MHKAEVFAISRIRIGTDGEGVTTLVTFTGCPLRCAFCINPSSWDNSGKSETLSVEDLYNRLKIDDLYFVTTGGGVMFGGGEPLLRADFIAEFAENYKSLGWNFYMETSLSVPTENLAKVIPYIDYFVVDSKDMDPERYKRYTKGDLSVFENNLKYLLDAVGPDRIKVRVPIIPNLHKTTDAAVQNAEILRNMGVKNIEIFTYTLPASRKKLSVTALNRFNEFIDECEMQDL